VTSWIAVKRQRGDAQAGTVMLDRLNPIARVVVADMDDLHFRAPVEQTEDLAAGVAARLPGARVTIELVRDVTDR
jgi:hypothetical protein